MDTPRSSYPTFSWTDRRHLLRALAQAHDARLYRRLRAAVAEIAEGKPVAVVAKHARVKRSTVYRWIERYLAERAPCSLADGKRSGRSRMTPALTHAVQQILARVPVAAHLATYLVRPEHGRPVPPVRWPSGSTEQARPAPHPATDVTGHFAVETSATSPA